MDGNVESGRSSSLTACVNEKAAVFDDKNIYTHARTERAYALPQSHSLVEPLNDLLDNVFLSVFLHEGMPHLITVHQSFVFGRGKFDEHFRAFVIGECVISRVEGDERAGELSDKFVVILHKTR